MELEIYQMYWCNTMSENSAIYLDTAPSQKYSQKQNGGCVNNDHLKILMYFQEYYLVHVFTLQVLLSWTLK